MSKYSKESLIQAHKALLSTLHKCEAIDMNKLGKSQKTLLTRRIEALKISLELIDREKQVIGVEIDFVVKDARCALETYEDIFDVERIEVTDYPVGNSEAIFSIYGTHFHILDENHKYMLYAPKDNYETNTWINITVPNIQETYQKAMNKACISIQEPIKVEAMGITNAMFKDPFDYVWMLHEIHEMVSFEKRLEIMEEQMKKGQ